MSTNRHDSTARFYRGLWRVLADWFAIPEKPPELPGNGVEPTESFRPSDGFLRYLKLKFWLSVPIGGISVLVVWFVLLAENSWIGLGLIPVFAVIALVPSLTAYTAIHLQFDATWYVLSRRSLRIRRGIWTIRETTITFENIQNVRLRQGPVQRYFGIADVEVSTAGGGVQTNDRKGPTSSQSIIEGVSDAERIRDLILTRIRASGAAGLGDDVADHLHRGSADGWSARHVEMLRDINGELGRLISEMPEARP